MKQDETKKNVGKDCGKTIRCAFDNLGVDADDKLSGRRIYRRS